MVGTGDGSEGGMDGGAVQRESAMSRASRRTHRSTEREKALERKMRDREWQIGRVYMLARNLVKTVPSRRFMSTHDSI